MYPYETLLNPMTLPVPKNHCRVHYEGSIDKLGGNADWDWKLYQDYNGEWVLFEHLGPGCIYNFVQHRYPSCEEPTFRFYFDGEETPRFTIRHSEFGEKYPFIEPLASRYIGPYDHGRGPIRVIRSFVPMPFQKSCRITSDILLEGYDRSKNQGGWGHVIFHSYDSDTNIETFQPEENPMIQNLTSLWKQTGSCIHTLKKPKYTQHWGIELSPGTSHIIFEGKSAATIAGIRLLTTRYTPEYLKTLSVKIFWDFHETPDVDAPFGCLFSNELGYHSVNYLFSGMNTDGYYYNFYPMPYEKNCKILLENHNSSPVTLAFCEILWTEEWNDYYQKQGFYYFRSAPYYHRRHTEGSDSIIACIEGSGHIISSTITAFGETPESRADCEGDVRIYIDNIRTPQIESDGSESYSCYGWGFETPQEYNPASGYDGHEHKDWSMHRSLPGDWYPFFSGFRFEIESGGCNDVYMEHSGMVFYYGSSQIRQHQIGELVLSDNRSRNIFQYNCENEHELITLTSYFEGNNDHIPVTLTGNKSTGKRSFSFSIPAGSTSLILRRVSDQSAGQQLADVFVDDTRILEYPWYVADHNPHKKWLEDEFLIPEKYIAGKNHITIQIVPRPHENMPVTWNDFGYQFFVCI